MKNIKKITAICLALVLALSLTACSSASQPTADNTQTQGKTLTFGAMASVEMIPIIMAEENGYFEKQGVNVELQYFKSAKDRDAALQSGKLDGIIGDEVAVTLYQNAGLDVKITGLTDGNFVLIAGPDSGIKTIADIKGKSAAISEKTVIEYTLDKVLEKNGLNPTDVQKSMIPAMPTRLEMLRTGKVDTALLPEPFASLAVKSGGIVLGSANEVDMYTSITAFTQESIDNKSDEIKAFFRAYNEAVDYVNSTPIAEYEDIIIKTVGYPEDMKGQIILPEFRKNMLPSEQDIQSVIEWAKKNNLLNKELSPKDLVSNIGVN
ncbi:MAG: metal transporter substrate-binding protein [Clostridia bacterium]|nr:metal transporter substrate-binding protein [Clostridia bacterium]